MIASPKHFAVHSGPESTRHEANIFVSPHDLEDTYLPAFRAAIVEGQAGSIMCDALPQATVALVPWSSSITDGDPIPTSALRSPDGKPGLLAEYYDADEVLPKRYATHAEYAQRSGKVKFKSRPTVSRIEPGIAVRGNEFARLSDYYRVVWTGFLVPSESGTYRIGIGGPNAELVLDGKVLAQHRHKPWGTRSEMVALELEKGQAYPIRATTDALLLARSAAVRGLFDERPHVSVLRRDSRLPVRLRFELFDVRVRVCED